MLSRLAVLFHLVLLCVCLLAWLPGDCQAQAKGVRNPGPRWRPGQPLPKEQAAPPRDGKPGPGDPTWDVKGWGKTQAEAEKDALAKARDLVKEYLRRQDPPVLWTPTPEFVRDHLVKGPARRLEDEDQVVQAGKEEIKAQCWELPVAVTARDRDLIAVMENQRRAEQDRLGRLVVGQGRELLLGKVLAALVAVLLAVMAYIRLDDWTKGFYSRWLAVVGVGLVALACVAMWLR
jgi:hypothetical protein